jgi:hypothetical protein
MKSKTLGTVFLLLATLLFAGCRSAPVYNVSDAPFTSTEQGVTQQDIAGAIMTAGRSLGWIMKEQKPGHILATLHLRTHTAIVDIFYGSTKYSITYKDSTNLGYDGTNIHSNYNGWIQNLSNAIDAQVSNL